jgi:Holliday junction DNA helicase RuvA
VIALLRGTLVRKEGDALVVLAGGVGYRLRVPVDLLCDVSEGAEVEMQVHTHVREDAIELFGFRDVPQLRLFERLLSVQKVGPRLALGLLSSMRPDGLVDAIRAGELGLLSRAPGVGRKTAERIVLELRDKLDDLAIPGSRTAPEPVVTASEDVVSALVNLGYTKGRARQAADEAATEAGDDAPLEEVLRSALRRLAG